MVTDQKDVLSRLKEARAQSQSSNSRFFFLKDGEKALVRVLRNHNEMVPVKTHRKFDETLRKFDPHAVCAKEFGNACQWCQEAQNDRKLTPRDLFYLPVYVHSKIGADGQKREINTLLYLEMTDSDGILIGLEQIYYEDETHDITNCDFVISRVGSGSKSKYTVIARRGSPAPLPQDITFPNAEKTKSDVEIAHPMKAIEEDAAPVVDETDPFLPDLPDF